MIGKRHALQNNLPRSVGESNYKECRCLHPHTSVYDSIVKKEFTRAAYVSLEPRSKTSHLSLSFSCSSIGLHQRLIDQSTNQLQLALNRTGCTTPLMPKSCSFGLIMWNVRRIYCVRKREIEIERERARERAMDRERRER